MVKQNQSTGFSAHRSVKREIHALTGKAKESLLPPNVVLVVHKPGHQILRPAIEEVYRRYGITSLHMKPRRFTPSMVKHNYKQVIRKLRERIPDIEAKLLEAYSSTGSRDHNIAVELVHIPQSAIDQVKAKDAWDAIKKIAGKTDPVKAHEDMAEAGAFTIRGNAFRRYGDSHPDIINNTLNAVHVPDPVTRAVEQRHLTGRWPDLALFTTVPMLLAAKKKYNELKAQGKLHG